MRRGRIRGSSQGVALIVALFAVTILAALVVAFAGVARTDALLAGNRRAMLQGVHAAQSGVQYCRYVLAADDASLDSTAEDWAQIQQDPVELDIPGFTVAAKVEDESARLNINTANKDMLMALPGMTDEASDSILDWRDADDDPRPAGAESDYYLSLPSAYEAANANFETVAQLRLVQGVDRELFEGDGSEASPGLRNLVTVRSGERNVDRRGRPRLNINTASSEELASIFTSGEAAAIVRQRPFVSLGQALGIQGVSWRKMAGVLDRICVDSRTFLEGTVNLNTAGGTVLEAIGLSPEVAAAVVERRSDQPFESKGDLAEVAGVNEGIMRAVADRIATKSSVFRVTAWAQPEDRPIVTAVFALLDRSANPARVILWRQLFGREAQPPITEEQESGP
jgi:general secretion pathway protein K